MSTLPTSSAPDHYPTPAMSELFRAVLSLHTEQEVKNFFRDLLTIGELEEFANRWQMVKFLVEGKPYTEIAKRLHTSTTTVTRVAQWLHHGMGGYQTAASRVLPKSQKK